MLLFIISFLLVNFSSYLITSVIAKKNDHCGLLYFPLISFSQVILIFEILSIFNNIKITPVLALNLLIFITALFIWKKHSGEFWTLNLKRLKAQITNSFKLDKSLSVLYVGFCVFIISAFLLALVMGITSADAAAYHVNRSLFWVLNGNLNHFDISDVRNICLPINSEILYSWVILFNKNPWYLGLFSFFGYIATIISTYSILGLMGYSTRKKLWVIFMLSSFSSVIVQSSGTETDIILAGLVSSSIFLFWKGLKDKNNVAIFMSALAYALAIGTKTPSLMTIPAVGCFLLGLAIYYKKREFAKPILAFLGFGTVNFILFASFCYVQNLFEFHSISGPESFMLVSKNYFGIKGTIYNFIKYNFLFIDFTGLTWNEVVNPYIIHVQTAIIKFLGLSGVKDGLYGNYGIFVNRTLLEPIMGAGILGFLVYYPCLILGLLKINLKKPGRKNMLIFSFAALFFVNLIVMSALITYMPFSIRFLMYFMLLSAPILVLSYKKKGFLKNVIVAFSMFYLVFVSTHLWPRPLVKLAKIFAMNPSISNLRERGHCLGYLKKPEIGDKECMLKYKIKETFKPGTKILAFQSFAENVYYINALNFEGYKVDAGLLETPEKINFDDYNILIIPPIGQVSSYIKQYDERKNEVRVEENKVFIKQGVEIPCLYEKNTLIPKFYNGKELPAYQVQCAPTQNYLTKHGFKKWGYVGMINRHAEDNAKNDYYVVYQNTNNPPKYK